MAPKTTIKPLTEEEMEKQLSIKSFMVPRSQIPSASQELSATLPPPLKRRNLPTSTRPSFPFMKLPPEIRLQIYKFTLNITSPVSPTHIKSIRTYKTHLADCVGGSHAFVPNCTKTVAASGRYQAMKRHSLLLCTNEFTGEVTSIPAPNSVLCLLETCRKIYVEAHPLFYKLNRLSFTDGEQMLRFLQNAGKRLEYVTAVTVRLTGSCEFILACSLLSSLKRLESLHLKVAARLDGNYDMIPGWQVGNNLSYVSGWEATQALQDSVKDLRDVVIIGYDHVLHPSHHYFMKRDINDPDAAGPILKASLMKVDQGNATVAEGS